MKALNAIYRILVAGVLVGGCGVGNAETIGIAASVNIEPVCSFETPSGAIDFGSTNYKGAALTRSVTIVFDCTLPTLSVLSVNGGANAFTLKTTANETLAYTATIGLTPLVANQATLSAEITAAALLGLGNAATTRAFTDTLNVTIIN